jgi:sugar/nucleoside kinase (ribokinase family)
VEKVVDTLGAGDAFAARFMVDYLGGISVQDAL